jgi:hypothetical protein
MSAAANTDKPQAIVDVTRQPNALAGNNNKPLVARAGASSRIRELFHVEAGTNFTASRRGPKTPNSTQRVQSGERAN